MTLPSFGSHMRTEQASDKTARDPFSLGDCLLGMRNYDGGMEGRTFGRLCNPHYLPSLAEVDSLRESPRYYPELLRWREKNTQFELFTREFIAAFSEYLAARVSQISGEVREPVRLLEVGAGTGRLSHFVRGQLRVHLPDIEYSLTATDNGSWKIEPEFDVRKMEVSAAIKAYKPHIAISSWMPMGKDWTGTFRACSDLREYVLIGKPDLCGTEGTFGRERGEPAPGYLKDGFQKRTLRELHELQRCVLDMSGESGSQIVAFRRRPSAR